MHVAILQGDEIENELDIVWHCSACTIDAYKWTIRQYDFVRGFVDNGKAIPVPLDVDDSTKFCAYIKSLQL